MSESTISSPRRSESENSGGFRSFWKKSNREAQAQNVTFVQQDPSGARKGNRISRLFRSGGTTASSPEAGEGSTRRRRQQVYDAQKRHRNRKAEYVQTLEAEIARLQHLDAVVNSEKNVLAHQNGAMRDFLASQSLDAHLDSMDLSSASGPFEDLSLLGSAAVDLRFDQEMGHDRTFIDFDDISDMKWTTSDTTEEGQPSRPKRHAPVKGDSWAALDFILALEWPCSGHVKHHGINPDAAVPEACDVGHFHGHALTATSAVYQSALPPPSIGNGSSNQQELQPNTQAKWQLPHSEIDKLVLLSEELELDDEILTPAQAYSAIRETVPNEAFLRPTLEALKKPLGSLVRCNGFGACMDAQMFWQHLDATIQTLKLTRPELGQGEGAVQYAK